MTDRTEERLRDGLDELARTRPDIAPLRVAELIDRPPARRTGAGRRWLLVAAACVLVIGLGTATWAGLRGNSSTIVAAPAAAPGDLTGLRWTATQLDGRPTAALDDGRRPYLEFGADGRLSGADPCNQLTGTYQLHRDQLIFSDVVHTEIACGDNALTTQQQVFVDALYAVTTASRDGATLALQNATGRTVLILQGDDPTPPPTTEARIRIRNDSETDFDRVLVAGPNGRRVDYGPLAAGQTSDYRGFATAYRYAFIQVRLPNDGVYSVRPRDYVGETPLQPGYYTYALDLRGSGNNTGLELIFESE